jgi:hypothetical protein
MSQPVRVTEVGERRTHSKFKFLLTILQAWEVGGPLYVYGNYAYYVIRSFEVVVAICSRLSAITMSGMFAVGRSNVDTLERSAGEATHAQAGRPTLT